MANCLKTFCFFLAAFLFTQAVHAQTATYLNPQKTVEERVNDLISRMRLREKVSQMHDEAPAIKRLHIPAYNWWNESLHGVARSGLATSFPQAIGLAATWNKGLMQNIAGVISNEARAKYNMAQALGQHGRYQGLTFWSPNINIFRDPRWGRGQETYGEDPYLTGCMAVAYITGMQGNDARYYKVVATAKHFAVHSGPESKRHSFNTDASDYDLRETYLPAFKMCVQQAHVASLMCAYNSLNGKACCGNNPLLNDILRNEWGFKGYVVSDCGAIRDIFMGHHQAAGAAAASAMAVKAGTDLECGSNYLRLIRAVRKGLVKQADIDTSLKRLFTARIKLGMFDPDAMVPYSKLGRDDLDSKSNRAVALQAAREAIVLLKNEGHILPLSRRLKTIAVIGPNANDTVAPLGNYNGLPAHTVSPLEGIMSKFGPGVKVIYEKGCNLAGADNESETRAVDAAKNADVVIMCMGLSPRLEGEEMPVKMDGFAGGDRTSLDLPAAQQKLIRKIAAVGKPLVLILINGSALSINWESKNLGAIIEAWYGGQAAGTAIADVLTGDYNPSGRLPVTFYQSVAQLPDFEDYSMKGRTYRYFNGDVIYPFGYGLSYTGFTLSNLQVTGTVKQHADAKIKVDVKNTGTVPGAQVIELYVKGKGPAMGDAFKTLKGFEKVYLEAGETKTVELKVSPETLTFYKEGAGYILEPGQHDLMIGTSSANSDLQTVKVLVE